MGYAEENIGDKIFVPDLNDVITTVHAVLMRLYPILLTNISKSWKASLSKLTERDGPSTTLRSWWVFAILMMKDSVVYETTRVSNRRGYVAAYCRLNSTSGSDS